VVSRIDRSRGIVFQDASMGTDIDATPFLDDAMPSLSRYSRERHETGRTTYVMPAADAHA
jgi:hypothetical protein